MFMPCAPIQASMSSRSVCDHGLPYGPKITPRNGYGPAARAGVATIEMKTAASTDAKELRDGTPIMPPPEVRRVESRKATTETSAARGQALVGGPRRRIA